MAEGKRTTAEQVVGYRLEGEEGLDFLRESLRWVVGQLMEAEVSELIGAEHGERSAELRAMGTELLTVRVDLDPGADPRWVAEEAAPFVACAGNTPRPEADPRPTSRASSGE